MNLYNPAHPGELIKSTYLKPFGYSCRFLAKELDVASSTLSRILKGQSGITPEMALRLSKALGRSPETWLTMQGKYDLWHAKKNINLRHVHAISFKAS
jgi:addiction module HigA family antidote|tara:strand:+ start:130 stop:423 length:294 start_codon:yes stop_codon:yes gene_type:complete